MSQEADQYELVQIRLEDLILTVDNETANKLKDPEYAENYLKEIRAQLEKENREKKCTLWKSSKSPTAEDHQSTLALLSLRHTYNEKFADKKTSKNELWSQIATKMNDMGYFVGEGVEGREKVRQKFSNLQTTYIKYCDSRKRTGEGKIKQPKYLDELESILGDKHKTNPVLVIDSLPKRDENSDNSQSSFASGLTKDSDDSRPGTSKSDSSSYSSADSTSNRFSCVKQSVRPKPERQRLLEELLKIQRENQHSRKEEFQTLLEVIREDSRERHNQLMAVLSQRIESTRPHKKRQRESDSD